ncbi:hypothetical protein WICPIJ_003405 [Wickerhamomyces pijperi]|uniref:Uncharacterized protein n=1 Tax=Wickerhamomyces pijperi TaxID=599730 RepID=A0A9P8Q9M0_WICPI|nr:hypothetical protein WICPIJ_003405 [Wickerhamomyces pijperi]
MSTSQTSGLISPELIIKQALFISFSISLIDLSSSDSCVVNSTVDMSSKLARPFSTREPPFSLMKESSSMDSESSSPKLCAETAVSCLVMNSWYPKLVSITL